MKTATSTRLLIWIRACTFVLMAVAAVLLMSEAGAAELSLLGGYEINSASFSGAIPSQSKSTINYGATVDFPMNPQWSFETGALYGAHAAKVVVGANGMEFKQQNLSIPAMVRYHFGPVVSIGVGGYYALSMGNSKSATITGGVTGAETDSGTKLDNDYGLVASLKAEFPAGGKVRFALEGRYDMGLKEVDAGGTPAKFGDINALAGIVFAL